MALGRRTGGAEHKPEDPSRAQAGTGPPDPARPGGIEEEMPRVRLTRRQIILFAVFMASAIGFLYFVLPKLTSAGETINRIEKGDKWWIGVGVVFEVLSFGGYIALFRTVFVKRPR